MSGSVICPVCGQQSWSFRKHTVEDQRGRNPGEWRGPSGTEHYSKHLTADLVQCKNSYRPIAAREAVE